MTITLDDLTQMNGDDLFEVMRRGFPLDFDAIADTTYTGIDLSMPALFHRLMWKSFRKTFHRDPVTGVLRGWNVKVEQTGWDTPPAPLRKGNGERITFGHYEVRAADALRFPKGWSGAHYLDYHVAGNTFLDLARVARCPVVTVNEGDSNLLLGWEVLHIAGVFVPIRDFWALKREGPLKPDDIVPRPDGHSAEPTL